MYLCNIIKKKPACKINNVGTYLHFFKFNLEFNFFEK